MTRRLLLLAAAVTTLVAGPGAIAAHAQSTAAAPTAAMTNDYGDWFCVAIVPLGAGVCQGDPLPQHLPVPQHILPPLPAI